MLFTRRRTMRSSYLNGGNPAAKFSTTFFLRQLLPTKRS